MKEKGHLIGRVLPQSIAEELGIEPGDRLLAINGQEIMDVFDYQYYIKDEYIEVLNSSYEFYINQEARYLPLRPRRL